MSVRSDTELLDWLQAKLDEKRYSGRCIFRWSDSGRGMRLHETIREDASSSVRVAINKAIEEEGPY